MQLSHWLLHLWHIQVCLKFKFKKYTFIISSFPDVRAETKGTRKEKGRIIDECLSMNKTFYFPTNELSDILIDFSHHGCACIFPCFFLFLNAVITRVNLVRTFNKHL